MAFTKKIPTNQQTRMATFQIIHNCCCESVVQPEIKKMGMDNLCMHLSSNCGEGGDFFLYVLNKHFSPMHLRTKLLNCQFLVLLNKIPKAFFKLWSSGVRKEVSKHQDGDKNRHLEVSPDFTNQLVICHLLYYLWNQQAEVQCCHICTLYLLLYIECRLSKD